MKRFITVLLVAVMVMCCFANVAFASADGIAQIKGSHVNTEVGGQATVSFSVEDMEYISYWFELDYDSTYLEIVSIDKGSASPAYFDSYTQTKRIAAAANENTSAEGVLFTVTFKATENCELGKSYPVNLKVLEVRNADGSAVQPTVSAGSVTIACDHTPVWDYNDDFHWHVCEKCGAKLDEEEAHKLEKKTDKAATATEDGIGHWECECGLLGETFAIPATGEDLDDVPDTGDITNKVTFAIAAILVAMFGMTVLAIKRRKVK